MTPAKGSFFDEVKSFANEHTLLCALTLGLAVVGYSIGNLTGRAISWLSEYLGTTEKTDAVANEIIVQKGQNDSIQPIQPHVTTLSTSQIAPNLTTISRDLLNRESNVQGLIASEIKNQERVEVLPEAASLLEAYKTQEKGWVMVFPKGAETAESRSFSVGSGAIGFEGNGRWKVHVSINPEQMEKAIPIIIDVLRGSEAPRLGFKMQTLGNLQGSHQIGKEIAILFDAQDENATLNNTSTDIQDCLSRLWSRLFDAGIRPEPGYVLTAETIREIKDGGQQLEKDNLAMGKFDRAIPCPEDSNFFYYRDENFVPMKDDEIGDLKGTPGVFAASDIHRLARRDPSSAHNPSRAPDPFINLHIHRSSD